ncbi:MAG TPA: dihydrolipoamide acetyltransferase family protein [Humibacter sp.]|jgi:pyruvate dehydrogenase E2 component (dihydrolipoamide acetyltransferase)|nr:dihydrolipoamide acetyltransferase family protein [Humibacter sp.]
MSVREFPLPDLGEGLTESEIVAWKVSVGDRVELNQIIAEVETAKALVEVPSPFEGTVRALHAEPGQTLDVGAPLVSFEVEDGADDEVDDSVGDDVEPADAAVGAEEHARVLEPVVAGTHAAEVAGVSAEAAEAVVAAVDAVVATPVKEERHEVLVGRGPKEQSAQRPHRRPRSGRMSEPIVRDRTIREEGVSSDAGETRAAATGVRRRTAEAMVRSAAVPQVTEFLTVDVTRGIRLLERLAAAPEFRGRRVTVLTLAAKALCIALAATPDANARWDDATDEIVTPPGVNLGIAVATDRGLVVPNVRDADGMRMSDLADAIRSLVENARAGRSTPTELTGGTVTITNVGVFGVDAGTPLLNPGETAILALGAVNRRPWEHKNAVRLRHVMTLSLTFDHRVIDGEQGSRLLRDIARILADPASALALT